MFRLATKPTFPQPAREKAGAHVDQPGSPADYIARIISITGVALPNFWVGILIVYFLVLFFAWMPPLGYANLWEDPATNLQQFLFPALALGFFEMAFTTRVTRSSMLEVYREDPPGALSRANLQSAARSSGFVRSGGEPMRSQRTQCADLVGAH